MPKPKKVTVSNQYSQTTESWKVLNLGRRNENRVRNREFNGAKAFGSSELSQNQTQNKRILKRA